MRKWYLKNWKLQIPVESHYTRPNPSEVDFNNNSKWREKLVKIQNQNESLHQMRAELTNLDRIERIAKGELNMTLPQKTILYEPKYEAKFKSN